VPGMDRHRDMVSRHRSCRSDDPARTPANQAPASGAFCHRSTDICHRDVVGLGRVERPTSRLSGVRSDQLSYRPPVARPTPAAAARSRGRLLPSVI
jgi:hypothetical protein